MAKEASLPAPAVIDMLGAMEQVDDVDASPNESVCFHITKTYQYINLCGMASPWLICSWRLKKPLGMVPDQGLFLSAGSKKCILQLFSFPGKIFIFSREKLNDLSWEKPTSEGAKKWTITYATCAFYMLPSSNG